MFRSTNSFFKDFISHESSGGILLMGAALLAILAANSPWNSYYVLLIDTPVAVRVGGLEIAKPLLLWVNDGLMAIFFLLVGLELKREVLEGELIHWKKVVLPAFGAFGGMLFPACFYLLLNMDDPVAVKGWAIPAATDIAFALGVLSLLGSRVPVGLKVFLTSLAIFDDIGAILIIALFYTSNISLLPLVVVGGCMSVLLLFNMRGVGEKSLYILIGIIMWVAMLKSGVHATLTGIVLAMFIPMQAAGETKESPLKILERDLHPTVALYILPTFAFCNAGIDFGGLGLEALLHGIPLGIVLGLFVGKQVGIFSFCWLGIKLGYASLPSGVNYRSLYGTATLCGIGFTMSLFIGSLAFEETGVDFMVDERLGIIVGSLLSGIAGFLILRSGLKARLVKEI